MLVPRIHDLVVLRDAHPTTRNILSALLRDAVQILIPPMHEHIGAAQ